LFSFQAKILLDVNVQNIDRGGRYAADLARGKKRRRRKAI